VLNLNPIFVDAIIALEHHAELVRTPPLPAAIFMLQRDVINHYQYALTHYLCLSLEAPFLQSSSLGSPYDKWAKFTNDDFGLLAFSVHGLLRYTSRLVHETTCRALESARRFDEMKSLSNSYTDPIWQIRDRAIGIEVHDDHALSVTALGSELVVARWDISNRSVIREISERCEAELASLSESTRRFATLCEKLYARSPVIADFDAMNQSWWI
jgi:hypothetical protein